MNETYDAALRTHLAGMNEMYQDGAETSFEAGWQACVNSQDKQAEPVAWVRRHPDGALTAEFLEDALIEPVRKKSGAWVPLYTHPAPAVMQEPVHFRAVICKEQQEQALGVVPKIVGFVDKKAAEQFILEKRDFQGWRYNLEPLYTEAPAVVHPPADVVRELVDAAELALINCHEPWYFADRLLTALIAAKEHGL